MKAILKKLYGKINTTELKRVELNAISDIRTEYEQEAEKAYNTFSSAIDEIMVAEETLARLFSQGPGLAILKDRMDELEAKITDLGIDIPDNVANLKEQVSLASEYYDKMLNDNYSGRLEGMRYDMVTLLEKMESLDWN